MAVECGSEDAPPPPIPPRNPARLSHVLASYEVVVPTREVSNGEASPASGVSSSVSRPNARRQPTGLKRFMYKTIERISDMVERFRRYGHRDRRD